MYSQRDWSVTPRPMYPADGRKLPDVYTRAGRAARRAAAERSGTFPLFNFWGPRADITLEPLDRRRARCTCSTRARPTLTLVYLPHLDYDLQRLGPDDPARRAGPARGRRGVRRADRRTRERDGARVIVLSEYGITPVSRRRRTSTARCARRGCSRCATSSGASCSTPAPPRRSRSPTTRSRTSTCDEPERVAEVERAAARAWPASSACSTRTGSARRRARPPALGRAGRGQRAPTAGSPTTTGSTTRARPTSRAPSTSTASPATTRSSCSSIPTLAAAEGCTIGWRLAKKALGFRYLMDVIPLDATLVKGSHGRLTDDPAAGPLFISSEPSSSPTARSTRRR